MIADTDGAPEKRTNAHKKKANCALTVRFLTRRLFDRSLHKRQRRGADSFNVIDTYVRTQLYVYPRYRHAYVYVFLLLFLTLQLKKGERGKATMRIKRNGQRGLI